MSGSTKALAKNEPRVYYDSGIIVAVGRGPVDMHYGDVVRVPDAVERGGCQGVTSLLAIMEAVDVTRKRSTESYKYRSGSDRERKFIDRRAGGSVTTLLSNVCAMERRRLLQIIKPRRRFGLSLMYAKLLKYAGHTAPGIPGRRCRYSGVGPYDLEHFALALDAGAAAICTTDAAFAHIVGNDDMFGHIKIQLASDPLIDLLSRQDG